MSKIAESMVIGCLIQDVNCIDKIYGLLTPAMFKSVMLGRMYKEIIKLYDINKVPDIATIVQDLTCDGIDKEEVLKAFKFCIKQSYMTIHIKQYADVIISDYKFSSLQKIIKNDKIAASTIDDDINNILTDIENLKNGNTSSQKKLCDIVRDNAGYYFTDAKQKKLMTGFDRLDNLTGGLEGGDVIVIGARPAVGKSAFITQIILQMAENKNRVAFYNLEMSDRQIYERMLSNKSKIGLSRIRKANSFLGEEKERFENANNEISELDVYISSGSKRISEIKNECKHQDYDCIIIDYLQLVISDSNYGNRVSEVGAISKSIKAMAMDLNIPVIALSQLNRMSDFKANKIPTMSELREAGDIEQDASVIMLMWNTDERDKNKKALRVEKNRQGETGDISYLFKGSEMKFIETDEKVVVKNDGFSNTDYSPFS